MSDTFHPEEAVAFVKETITMDVRSMEDVMSSLDASATLWSVYSSLNKLYEKTRTMESLLTYADSKTKEWISEKKAAINQAMLRMEKESDALLTNRFVSFSAQEDSSFLTGKDRNGTNVSTCKTYQDWIVPGSQLIENALLKTAVVQSPDPTLHYDHDHLLRGIYRSAHYLEVQEPQLTEEISFGLEQQLEANSFFPATASCQLTQAILTNLAGEAQVVERLPYFPSYPVAGYKVKLKSPTILSKKVNKNSDNEVAILAANKAADVLLDNATGETVAVEAHYFGVDDIHSLRQSRMATSSIFFSQPIEVGACEYLQLSADIDQPAGSAVEFYLIDGTKEWPILEKNTSIAAEKVFADLPLRFTCSTSAVSFMSGQLSTLSLSETRTRPAEEFVTTYAPDDLRSAKRVSPKATTVAVKAILRGNERAWPRVRNISIHKFGGITSE